MEYKLLVKKVFTDKYDHKTEYKVGSTLVTDEEDRKDDLIQRGLVELIEEPKEETKEVEPAEVEPTEVEPTEPTEPAEDDGVDEVDKTDEVPETTAPTRGRGRRRSN